MIEWYDIVMAIVFAWVLLNIVFVPYIGFVWAYVLYEYGWNAYCQYRKNQNN